MTRDEPNEFLVASGPSWAGAEARSLERSLQKMIESASSVIHLITYAISSSAMPLIEQIVPKLDIGIEVYFIINRAKDSVDKNTIELLNRLASHFRSAHIYSFESASKMRNVHAKAVVVDREKAILGSANLSQRGLVENYELGLFLSGRLARDISLLIDKLTKDPECATFPISLDEM